MGASSNFLTIRHSSGRPTGRDELTRSSGWLEKRPLKGILVGSWPSASPPDGQLEGIARCLPPYPVSLSRSLLHYAPDWLLVGENLEEQVVSALFDTGQAMHRKMRLAMLGRSDDRTRCSRWLRMGCLVYVEAHSSLERVLRCLDLAAACGSVVIDACFQPIALASTTRLFATPSVTRREREILELVCLGFRNYEVANELHISINTVEFHMRNLFGKFGVHNRVQLAIRLDNVS